MVEVVVDHNGSDRITSAPSSPPHSPSAALSPEIPHSTTKTATTPTSTATTPKPKGEVKFSVTPGYGSPDHPDTVPPSGARTPMAFIKARTPKFMTPLGSPVRKVLRLTTFNKRDAWLPITASRNGNKYYAAFHTLCAGIGIQALILPVAFTILGWAWGVITLTLTFIWQLYTLNLLVNLHESAETGVRYSRYMQLARATFGERLGKLLTLFPIVYLSVGTCLACIIIGASTSKIFFQVVCGNAGNCDPEKLTVVEWYLVFTCGAVILSQLPNLNSIAGVSLIGAITALGYCTTIWIVSVSEGRLPNVSYNPVRAGVEITKIFDVLNALGIIAFAFRGHNLILEVQATMPSNEKHPSSVPMWQGVKVSYTLIALCLFPLAIGGYWAYGQLIPPGGMLTALFVYHIQDVKKSVLGLTCSFVIINTFSSFQIYAMPAFDEMEAVYVKRYKQACPWWLRVIIRTCFGFSCFLVAVAVPFVSNMAGLAGGVALPVTLVYPCVMWLKVKKPKVYSPTWCLNWGLVVLGTILSALLTAAGGYIVIRDGVKFDFFNPK